MGVKDFVRRAAKTATANVLHHTGMRSALGAVRRFQSGGRRIVIVGYHRVVEDFTGEVQRCIPGTLISKETFRRHLEEAHRAGFELSSLSHALEVMAGTKRSKKDLFVVTFDDGYLDVYENAFPVLKEMGVPAIVYLPSGYIGTDRRFNHDRLWHLIQVARERQQTPIYDGLPPQAAVLLDPIFRGSKSPSAALDDFIGDYPAKVLTEIIDAFEKQLGGGEDLRPPSGQVMSWDQAREMLKAGVDLGAHTVDHTVLTLQKPADAEAEIVACKTELEKQLGTRIRDFAYCNGWYSDELVRILAKHGFRSGVTTEDFMNRLGGDPYALKRKVLWENFSVGMLGDYSSSLTCCQLDDTFGMLGFHHPVPGKRNQFGAPAALSTMGAR
ncbi:MAG: polysaccharide deacetylase family protein [Myxococcaceae bacterium]